MTEKMIAVKGEKLTVLGFEFIELRAFVSWEGLPLISHNINNKNEDYLSKCSDKDMQFDRWMLYKTPLPVLKDYFDLKIHDRDLILKTPDGFVYFLDYKHKEINIERIIKVQVKNIPKDYLPSEKAHFMPKQYEKYALQLKSYLDYHFSRMEKLYKMPIENTQPMVAMEPPPYKKK